MTCPLDFRPSSHYFCKYHETALQSLIETYEQWKTAYETLSWSDYLETLLDSPLKIGLWVKEVIQYLKAHSDLVPSQLL